MARRGAAGLHRPDDDARIEVRPPSPAPEPWEAEEWVEWREEPTGSRPARPAGDQATPRGHRHNVPAAVVAEVTAAAGPIRGPRLAARLADASHAYERERYADARRALRPVLEEVPDVPAVAELGGLVAYREGDWLAAARLLEAYRAATGSFDQHPVLADCYRALRRYREADALWAELREASPDADLVAEGRIVAAGCLADQGNLQGAIAVLERSARRVEHPGQRHLRQWYALADLYERAGDLPRSRDLFARLARADPDAFDVRQRLRALR